MKKSAYELAGKKMAKTDKQEAKLKAGQVVAAFYEDVSDPIFFITLGFGRFARIGGLLGVRPKETLESHLTTDRWRVMEGSALALALHNLVGELEAELNLG